MMEFSEFIMPELLILVPVLYILGAFIKQSRFIPDRFIPLLLGAAGVGLAVVYVLAAGGAGGRRELLMAAFTGVVQGVLCAGAAVYANQLAKQAGNRE